MRTLPGASVMGRDQTLLDFQVTVAPVEAPVLSTRCRPVVFVAPVAWFQLVAGTTPALSEALMAVPRPTKLWWVGLALGLPRGARTVGETRALCVMLPLVPVIVTG